MIPYVDENGDLHYSVWVRQGEMLVNREALSPNNPEHLYNYLLNAGITPENYGIKHPYGEMFEGKSRGELIAEIINLREQLESAERHGFY